MKKPKWVPIELRRRWITKLQDKVKAKAKENEKLTPLDSILSNGVYEAIQDFLLAGYAFDELAEMLEEGVEEFFGATPSSNPVGGIVGNIAPHGKAHRLFTLDSLKKKIRGETERRFEEAMDKIKGLKAEETSSKKRIQEEIKKASGLLHAFGWIQEDSPDQGAVEEEKELQAHTTKSDDPQSPDNNDHAEEQERKMPAESRDNGGPLDDGEVAPGTPKGTNSTADGHTRTAKHEAPPVGLAQETSPGNLGIEDMPPGIERRADGEKVVWILLKTRGTFDVKDTIMKPPLNGRYIGKGEYSFQSLANVVAAKQLVDEASAGHKAVKKK
jgi:hypothetical protein